MPGTDVRLLPESERILRRFVIGLAPERAKLLPLPTSEPPKPGSDDPRGRQLMRELYWLNFELIHGAIFKAGPLRTRFFIAVPDPKTVPEASGDEERFLREYLLRRVGWSAGQIAERVRFFRVSHAILFPQDMAEILGLDGRQRLVLGVGSDVQEWYRDPVMALARRFPEDFVVRTVGGVELGGINTEGGDLGLAWLPEGKVGLLVGRHRIARFLERRAGWPAGLEGFDSESIEGARRAFSQAFFGVETIIVGEEGLRHPDRVSDELFHADMVVNVMRGAGQAIAFVPSYRVMPVDAITHVRLPTEMRRRVQAEYDLVADQMARRGYRVVRLPFSDHPVRSPVNVSKFVEPVTGTPHVFLGRYPYHFPLEPGGPIAQFLVQAAFDDLNLKVGLWRREPSDPRWHSVEQSLEAVWHEIDRSVGSPNPEFERQAALYEENGIKVDPVPIYPTGSGGIHCLLFR